jgi:menaquinone-dependent protoporphyrinogen oxidase
LALLFAYSMLYSNHNHLVEEGNMNVLVAYATAHGSTAGVAQEIGRVLTERGLNVMVANIKEVRAVRDYDALVLGSAIHSGAWLPEMKSLFNAFQADLATKPIYLWLSCIRVMEQFGEEHVLEFYLDKEILNRLRIRNIAVFAGKLDLETTDWNERWTLAARYDGSTWPSSFDGDFRDWAKIQDWGNRIAAELQPVAQSS